MAWDYEKGCEVPNAYANKPGSTLYSPPTKGFPKRHRGLASVYIVAEMGVTAINYTQMKQAHIIEVKNRAESAFIKLVEEIMNWQGIADDPQVRTKFLEWLTIENKAIAMNIDGMSISDVDINKMPMMERIIATGYKKLATKMHPDLGGTTEDFQELTDAHSTLKVVLKEVKDLL